MIQTILDPISGLHVQAINRLFEIFPQLVDEQNHEWLEVLKNAKAYQLPAGTMLASTGTICNEFMLILDGSVRVFQHADDGREVTLYRIGTGDICLMSLNSVLHERPFRGNACSETEITVLAFDVDDFHTAMKVSDDFRTFVLIHLVDTVCGMVHMFHDTTFKPLKTRLGVLLADLFEGSVTNVLNVTHQDLAQELGSSREVISRLLKKMEQSEYIVLKRREILPGKYRNQLKDA